MRRTKQGLALATALLAGLAMAAGACAGPQPSTDAATESPAPAPKAEAQVAAPKREIPDYATIRAEWMMKHQPDEPNRWSQLANELSRVQGAWAYFVESNPAVLKWVAVDPEKREGALAPGMVFTAEASELLPEVREFLTALDRMQVARTFDEVSADGSFVPPRTVDPLLDEAFQDVGHARLLARLWSVRMRLAMADGDPDRLVQSVRHLRTMARAVAGRGQLISYLVAVAVEMQALQSLRRELIAGTLDPATCAVLLGDLRARPGITSLAVSIEGERSIVLDTLERFFEKLRAERAEQAKRSDGELIVEAMDVVSPRSEQLRLATQLFDGAILSLNADVQERTRGQRMVDEALRLIEKKSGPTVSPLSTLVPAFDKSAQTEKRYLTELRGTETMLALEIFKGRTGHYPERLQELVPEDLAALPMDPFAADRPLAYRRAAGAEGGYVLYSVALDGEDNDGQEHPKNVWSAFDARTGKGFDFVINRVRE